MIPHRHFPASSLSRLSLVLAMIMLGGCFSDTPSASWETTVQGVYSADLSRDGNYAMVGSIQHGGSLWRVSDAERLFNWNHKSGEATAITAMSFSPEGRFALTADERTLVLWDVSEGTALRYFTAPGEIFYAALLPDARAALLGLRDGKSVLFDIQGGGLIHEMYHEADILAMAISANGRYALFGLGGNRMELRDLDSGSVVKEFPSRGRLSTVALSSRGEYAFMAGQFGEAKIIDTRTGAVVSELDYSNPLFPNFSSFITAEFSADGSGLLTGNSVGAMEFWDLTSGRRIERWIMPKASSLRPTNFSVVAVAAPVERNTVLAMTSNGMTHAYDFSR